MAGMRRFRRQPADSLVKGPDMVRRRAAAAADDMGTGFDEQPAVLGEFFRRRLIDRLVTINSGKPALGLAIRGIVAYSYIFRTVSTMSAGPVEQFRPTASTPRFCKTTTAASGGVP